MITQTSRNPYFAPPAMFVAKLPGSMYATAATNAGPSNASRPRTGPRPRISWSGVCGCATMSSLTAVTIWAPMIARVWRAQTTVHALG